MRHSQLVLKIPIEVSDCIDYNNDSLIFSNNNIATILQIGSREIVANLQWNRLILTETELEKQRIMCENRALARYMQLEEITCLLNLRRRTRMHHIKRYERWEFQTFPGLRRQCTSYGIAEKER